MNTKTTLHVDRYGTTPGNTTIELVDQDGVTMAVMGCCPKAADLGHEMRQRWNSHPDILQALIELELRTRQFLAGDLVTFPAALLPQVRAVIAASKL